MKGRDIVGVHPCFHSSHTSLSESRRGVTAQHVTASTILVWRVNQQQLHLHPPQPAASSTHMEASVGM